MPKDKLNNLCYLYIYTFIIFIFTGKCGVVFKEKVQINSTFYPISDYEDIREEPPNILCCINPINITEIQLNNNFTSNSTQYDVPVNSTESSVIANQTVGYYTEIVYTDDVNVMLEDGPEFYNQSDSDARSFNQSDSDVRSFNQSGSDARSFNQTVYYPRGSGEVTKCSLKITLFFMMSIFAIVV